MARLPTSADISGPGSLRSGRGVARQDTTAEGRGLTAFGQGISDLGAGVQSFANQRRQQDIALGISRADAQFSTGLIGIENTFNEDGTYETWGSRAATSSQELLAAAAQNIPDARARELWVLENQPRGELVVDRISDTAFSRQQDQRRTGLYNDLRSLYAISTNPSLPEAERERARLDADGAIQVQEGLGLLTPDMAQRAREEFLEGGDFAFMQNAANSGAWTGPLPTGDAAAIIRQFEGFRETPYWDVNANRVGYGSDTITHADGTVERVTPGMVVTRADADRDLERRVREFEQGAIRTVGVDAWAALPENARAALVSIAYNYGSLPSRIVGAVRGGDVNAIAQAVAGLQDDNGGINRDRRLQEAAIIRGESNPAAYNRLLPGQQMMVSDLARNHQQQQASAQAAQQQAEYAALRDATELGILTGSVVSEQQILSNPILDDGDKASLLRTFRSQQETVTAAQAYAMQWANGEARALNPFLAEDRTLADNAYNELAVNVPPENRAAFDAQYIRETGVVPDPVVAEIRQGLSASSTDVVLAALQRAAQVSALSPQGIANASHGTDVREAADLFNALVNGRGYSAEDAARRYQSLTDPAQVRRREVLEGVWAEDAREQFTSADLVNAFGGGFFGIGAVSTGLTETQRQAIEQDYLAIAEESFILADGDVNVARELALTEMRRVYGPSSVSGQSVLMKYPPESFYPPIDGNHAYLREMALMDAREVFPDAENVYLDMDPDVTLSDIRAGQMPRYNLRVQMPDGTWEFVNGMFTVGDDLGAVQEQASERRRLEGEIQRLFVQAGPGNQVSDIMASEEYRQLRSELEALGGTTPVPEEIQQARDLGAVIGTMGGEIFSNAPEPPAVTPDLAEFH